MIWFRKRTLREKAAIAAMQAIIAKVPVGYVDDTGDHTIYGTVARGSAQYADELVNALDAQAALAYTVTIDAHNLELTKLVAELQMVRAQLNQLVLDAEHLVRESSGDINWFELDIAQRKVKNLIEKIKGGAK